MGRNGIFYDRKGVDWDATIIKIVEHPISVRQAFWMPYKRVGKLIGEQIEKFADYINNAGYASPIRTPRGRDILAACGQLKSESERTRKVDRLALEAMMIAGHGEA